MMNEPYNNAETIAWCRYVHDSYKHWLKKTLVEGDLKEKELVKALYEADFMILSHKFGDVPRFVFANLSAQKLWGYSWDEFIGMPSSESVEPEAREEREKLLERANLYGFINDYSGIRIAKDGRRFRIRDVTLWNVLNENEVRVGQAAMFRKFEFV